MKYALLEHKHGYAGLTNYGDHIQSLAAKQYLPKVDFYVERDELDNKSYEQAKIIMNGWFTYAPENWPPNENLEPYFISFHLNTNADKLLSNKENVEYLKKYAPIGCRDFKTVEVLEKYGIEAYYSFCLTSTLDMKYKSNIHDDKIYFIDPLYMYDQRITYKGAPKRLIYHTLTGKIFDWRKKKKILESLIPKDIIAQSIERTQFCPQKLSTNDMFNIAEQALSDYSRAKLVVTSRIHCALPCVALGTPVLFILDGLEDPGHMGRLNGIVDHMNILSAKPQKEINSLFGKNMNVIHPEDIDWNNPPQNPNTHLALAKELKQKCIEFIEK